MDIVGYSKLVIDKQTCSLKRFELNGILGYARDDHLFVCPCRRRLGEGGSAVLLPGWTLSRGGFAAMLWHP